MSKLGAASDRWPKTGLSNGAAVVWARALAIWLASLLPLAAAGADPRALPAPPSTSTIRFVFAGAFSSADVRARFSRLASTLGASMGHTAAVAEEPSSRALLSLATGAQQVDLARVPNFHERVPGAIRLEPHVVQVFYHALVAADQPPIERWDQLIGRRVAFMRGIQAIIDQLPTEANQHPVITREACVKLLVMRRVDACVLHLSQSQLPPEVSSDTPLQSRVLSSLPLYLWVGPGQAELARGLQSALSVLERSGELASIMGPLRSK